MQKTILKPTISFPRLEVGDLVINQMENLIVRVVRLVPVDIEHLDVHDNPDDFFSGFIVCGGVPIEQPFEFSAFRPFTGTITVE